MVMSLWPRFFRSTLYVAGRVVRAHILSFPTHVARSVVCVCVACFGHTCELSTNCYSDRDAVVVEDWQWHTEALRGDE